jgi:hypothetical protein
MSQGDNISLHIWMGRPESLQSALSLRHKWAKPAGDTLVARFAGINSFTDLIDEHFMPGVASLSLPIWVWLFSDLNFTLKLPISTGLVSLNISSALSFLSVRTPVQTTCSYRGSIHGSSAMKR